ncbi:hypothetical protein E8E12_000444, partial [Didymella heteroderae]
MSQLLLSQAATGTGHMLHYGEPNQPFMTRELLKRLYWLCFAAQCTQGLHHRPFLSFFGHGFNAKKLKPLEIADPCLAPCTPGEENWHGNVIS